MRRVWALCAIGVCLSGLRGSVSVAQSPSWPGWAQPTAGHPAAVPMPYCPPPHTPPPSAVPPPSELARPKEKEPEKQPAEQPQQPVAPEAAAQPPTVPEFGADTYAAVTGGEGTAARAEVGSGSWGSYAASSMFGNFIGPMRAVPIARSQTFVQPLFVNFAGQANTVVNALGFYQQTYNFNFIDIIFIPPNPPVSVPVTVTQAATVTAPPVLIGGNLTTPTGAFQVFIPVALNGIVHVPDPTLGSFKIAENESPRPQNRLFFNYNHFNGVRVFPTRITSPLVAQRTSLTVDNAAIQSQIGNIGASALTQIQNLSQSLQLRFPNNAQIPVIGNAGPVPLPTLQVITPPPAPTPGALPLPPIPPSPPAPGFPPYVFAGVTAGPVLQVPPGVAGTYPSAIIGPGTLAANFTQTATGLVLANPQLATAQAAFVDPAQASMYLADSVRTIVLDRYIFGFEKTFFNGYASFGMRVPAFQTSGDGSFNADDFGDITFILKVAPGINTDNGNVASVGVAVTAPTGPGLETLFGKIHPTLIQPFLGWLLNADHLYVQGFLSYVYPSDERTIQFFFADLGVGWWFLGQYGRPAGWDLAPTIELHWTRPLENRDFQAQFVGGIDQLDMTVGLTLLLNYASIKVGAVVPITQPRQFDVEGQVQLNLLF